MRQPLRGFELTGGCNPDTGLGNSLDQLGRSNGKGMSELNDIDEALGALSFVIKS